MNTLAVRELGQSTSDRPPVILLHGLFGSSDNLGAIARELAQEFKVYLLDLPNHGRSAHTRHCSLASMAEAVLTWMDSYALDSVQLLGHSLGGKVAMEVALQYPHRIAGLCVIDIAPVRYQPRHDQVFAGLFAVDLNAISQRSEAERVLKEYVEEPAVRSFLLKNLVKNEGKFQWRMNLQALYDGYSQLIDQNIGGCFGGSACFIKGGYSDYIKEGHRQEILQRFPQASLKIVPETGHWLHAEKPELVARLVKKCFVQARIA